MSEVEMIMYHGYHMQSNGVICKKDRRDLLLQPKFRNGEYRYHLIKDGKRFHCNAYKLFYAVFTKENLPENYWNDSKHEVFPINGYPMDLRIENLELVSKKDVSDMFTRNQIRDIVNIRNNFNTTIKIIADHWETTENTIRFILKRYKDVRGPKCQK